MATYRIGLRFAMRAGPALDIASLDVRRASARCICKCVRVAFLRWVVAPCGSMSNGCAFWLGRPTFHFNDGAGSLLKLVSVFVCRFCFAIGIMFSLQVLLGLLLCAFADAGAMPDINVQYEVGSANMAGADARSQFAKRTSQLATAIGQADARISQFSDLVGHALPMRGQAQRATSFLGLQPVDASRVRKSLAATEPMAPSSQAAVNVIMAEDVGAVMDKAEYKGMRDEIGRLHATFERGVAELAQAARSD